MRYFTYVLVCVLVFLSIWSFSPKKDWNLIGTQKFSGSVALTSIDAYGRLYSCDTRGNITRYDTLGAAELIYSPSEPLLPTFMATWNPNQLFIFYQELQEWVVLDRFLTEIERYTVSERIEDERIGFVRIMSPAPDNTLWFFDESDFSLKHYNIIDRNLISSTPLDLLLPDEDYYISHLQIYQGQIFLGIKEEKILLFDNFGNYKKSLSYPEWKSFSFHKEKLVLGFDNQVVVRSLYSSEEKVFEAPDKNAQSSWEGAYRVLSKWYWVNKDENNIYVRY